MKKRVSITAVIAIMAITAAITVSITYTAAMNIFEEKVNSVTARQVMYDKVFEIDQKVRQNYLNEVDEQALKDALSSGYINGLNDDYSRYLTADEYRLEKESENGEVYGIGLEIEKNSDGNILIFGITPNSPAENAGLKKGDIIVKVNKKSVTAVGFEKALEEITTTQSDSVSVTVKTQDGENTRTIQKAKYNCVTVEYSAIENVGYVRIKSFNSTTVDQFEGAINDLEKQKVSGYIFDVRDNQGGQIQSACKVLDRLLPAGTIYSSVDKNGKRTVEYTSDASGLSKPMAVLIDEKTSNTAELFAAVLRDFRKGKLVGVTTCGRGSIEKIFLLGDGSAVRLTVAKFLSPSGEMFDGVGVKPEFEVKPAVSDTNFSMLTLDEDNQLRTALDVVLQNAETYDNRYEDGAFDIETENES